MWTEMLRTRIDTAPNRIAVATALRGIIACAVPLVVGPLVGAGVASEFAVIGALGTAIIDVGGSYRARLLAMGANILLGPGLMLAGMGAGQAWPLAAAAMFVIGLGSGMVRVLGQGGITLGLINSISFLIGLQLPASVTPGEVAYGYVAGTVWTILVTLAFWQLRPYRRLRHEVAAAWEAVAELAEAARPDDEAEQSVVARRRREERIAKQHQLVREAIETARTALGEAREGTRGPATTTAQLLVLLRASSRIDAALVTLHELESREQAQGTARGSESFGALGAALADLEKACRAMARTLIEGRIDFDFTAPRAQLEALSKLAKKWKGEDRAAEAGVLEAQILAYAQAVRHLDAAEESSRLLFGAGRRKFVSVVPSFSGLRVGDAVAKLRGQLTFHSLIYRYALRAGLVGAIAAGAVVGWNIPHGFWLPMTALIVLQPDYSSTMARAVQRASGTIGGAVLAAVLLATMRGTVAYEVTVAILVFGTFLLLRRRYGWAVAFLTPLVILLLDYGGPDPWIDLRHRVLDTLAGAALAVAAGYALWPVWGRETVLDRQAKAVRSVVHYVAAILDALAGSELSARQLNPLRREAEVDATNADAEFQRMVAEPRHQRGRVAQGFTLNVFIRRLLRHAVALHVYVGAAKVAAAQAQELKRLLTGTLDDLASSLATGGSPKARPDLGPPLEMLRAALAEAGEGAGDAAAFLLGQIVADANSLYAAASIGKSERAEEPAAKIS